MNTLQLYCEYCKVSFPDNDSYIRHLFHPYHSHMRMLAEQQTDILLRNVSQPPIDSNDYLFDDLPSPNFEEEPSSPRSRRSSKEYLELFD